ncbi:MAG: alpha/beta hydrolase, partial [Spirochaetales bacterium]|nr:alpha/beta hydrolase [Spirochaetales bacterium]
AQKLFESGADVYAPLIPGFGSSPAEFIKTNYTSWYSYIRSEYLKRRAVYRYVFVVGSSMGGTLTLNLAEEMSGSAYKPDGVVTAAASVFINKISQGILKNPGLYIIRTAGWFTPQIGAGICRGEISREGDDGSSRWIGYTGIYPRQLYSLLMGMRRVRNKLQDITVPIQLFHSRCDQTVPFKNLFYIAGRAASPDVRMRIVDSGDKPHDHHCLLMYDSVRLSLTEEIICFIEDIKRKTET